MMGKTIFTLFLIFTSCLGMSQDIHIRGFVKESGSGEELIEVNVFDVNSQRGTTTNEKGYYKLTVPPGGGKLVYSYVGYNSDTIFWSASADTVIHIRLDESVQLNTITVSTGKKESIQETNQASRHELTRDQMEQLPALLGEVDVLKSLQLLPGIQGGTEGTAGVFVRGGSIDQNLILVDGVPIYNPTHVLGLFSTFNSDAIDHVSITKGGFPARFGGRLSSVIEVNLKEGDLEEFHGAGQIGLISSKLMVEGPIVPEKTSFLLSGRRSYTDLIARPVIKYTRKESEDNMIPAAYFHDINLKVRHRFNDKNKLVFSGYFGGDHYGVQQKGEIEETNAHVNWGNYLGNLTWSHRLTPGIFTSASVNYSRYRLENNIEYTFTKNEVRDYFNSVYQSGIDDLGAKYSMNFAAGRHHDIRLGVEWTHHTYTPGALTYGYELEEEQMSVDFSQDGITSHERSFYVEDNLQYGPLSMNAGVHFSQFFTDGTLYHSVQPRVSMRLMLPDQWALKLSYAQMEQYINLLASESLSLPSDLWVPSTARIRPQNSWQSVAGIAKTLWKDYEVSVEGYYKEMNNVLSYQPGVSFILDVASTENWQNKISQGRGWAYGGEFLFQKKMGSMTGWIAYSLTWNYRRFDDINDGKIFPFKYDRRHDVSVVLTQELSEKWSLSGVWIYGSGNAYSLQDTYFPVPDEYFGHPGGYLVYDKKNNYRMSDYHRLDISAQRRSEKKWGETIWNFGAYNAYFRKNPFYINQDLDGTIKEVSVLPIIPYISWGFKF